MNKCRNCMFLPPLGRLPSLNKLSIGDMDNVKEVGSELLGTGCVLPSLEILKFKNMPEWEVWSTNAGIVDAVFPCLQELRIEKCPNLVKVSLKALPSLRVLKLKNCGDGVLASLVHVASSVTNLSIKGISGLTDEVWGGVVQYLAAVEEVRIEKCNEVRYLWESAEACKVLVNLNKLDIWNCENLVRLGKKEEEANSDESKLLTSLRMLQIWGCKNLEYFSCTNSIEELSISWCSSITSAYFPAGGWQRLKSLTINECNNLIQKELEKVLTINTNMPPMLQVLHISDWKDLKSLMKSTCFIQLTELEMQDCPIIESFPNLQNLVLLKDLTINNCRRMDAPSRGGGRVWPPNLHSLRIGKLKNPMSKWDPQDFPRSLVDVFLYGGSAKEEDDVTSGNQLSHFLPSSLTILVLWELKKLESLSKGFQHLSSLQVFIIWFCPKTKDLPETLLSSLLSLTIRGCTNEELKEKTSRRGSYWPRLSHIPYVNIDMG